MIQGFTNATSYGARSCIGPGRPCRGCNELPSHLVHKVTKCAATLGARGNACHLEREQDRIRRSGQRAQSVPQLRNNRDRECPPADVVHGPDNPSVPVVINRYHLPVPIIADHLASQELQATVPQECIVLIYELSSLLLPRIADG